MEDEHAISVEETNKIRASLGLPLIPVESEKGGNVGGNDNAENTANENLSLEETNKIRASLGLKAIPTDSSTLGSSASQDEVAARNWKEKYEQDQKTKKEEELRKKLQNAKDKVQRNSKLQGKSLGDDDSYGSTASFLKNLRAKKNKKPTVSIPDEELDEERKDYTSKDLTGLKVGHKLSDIQDLTQDTVLTLKDSSVLDEEDGDQLVSESLVDKEKLEENKKNKKGLQQYKGYDDDEFEGKPKAVLSKYDEPDESDNFFVLDGSSTIAQKKVPSKEDEKQRHNNNSVEESLDFEGVGIKNTLSSDYQEAKPVKFKKKKSSKKKRKRTEEGNEPEEKKIDADMHDEEPEIEEEDDAQLRAFLTLSRRKAQKDGNRKRFKPEDLAEEIKNEGQKEQTPLTQEGEMVIGDTSDFLSTLAHNARNTASETEQQTKPTEEPKLPEPSTEDISMQDSEPATLVSEEQQDTSPLESENISVAGGMANALKLLQSRGVLKKKDEKSVQQEQERRKQKELVDRVQGERLKRDVERRKKREEERLSGKFDGWSQKEREQYAMEQNRAWEIEDAQEMQKIFANYKPNIDIRYSDDMGRELNTKEAYKHLCHQFHGKGPGKAKLEKQLQRMSEEREMEAASIFEADVNKARPTSARLQ